MYSHPNDANKETNLVGDLSKVPYYNYHLRATHKLSIDFCLSRFPRHDVLSGARKKCIAILNFVNSFHN